MNPSSIHRVGLLMTAAVLSFSPPDAVAQNQAEGSLTVDGESTEIRFAYAGEYDGDITVVLADAEVPREVIPDGTYDLAASGAFRGIVISVSSENGELQSGGWYELVNAVHFHPILNELGEIGEPVLATTHHDAESLSGTIGTDGTRDVSGHQVSYDVSFTVSLKREPLEVTVTGTDDEPSKAFEGWCQALFASDIETLMAYFPNEMLGMIPTDPEELAEGLEFQQMMMPTNIQIESSEIDGDQAVLKLRGTRGMEVSTGTVTMLKEDGRWKVGDQSWSSGDGVE